MESVELVGIQVDGFIEDVPDNMIDEDLYFEMAKALLEGHYKYELKSLRLRDKFTRGAVYLNIWSKERKLLDNYRCEEQARMKELLRRGFLQAVPYDKS